MDETVTPRKSFLPFLAEDYLLDASDSPFDAEALGNRQWGASPEPELTLREVSSNVSNRAVRFDFRKSRLT
jgi:hypothetical protein